jgi:hypothetical protein
MLQVGAGSLEKVRIGCHQLGKVGGSRQAGGQSSLGKARSQGWDLLDAVQVVVLVASLDVFHDGRVSMNLQCDALPLSRSETTLLHTLEKFYKMIDTSV